MCVNPRSMRVSLFILRLTAAVLAIQTHLIAQQLPFKTYSTADGLPQAQISSVMQDSKGFMWFVSNSGLSRYDGVEFRTYTKQDGLPSNAGIQLSEDAQGRMWALMVNGLAMFEETIDGRMRNVKRLDARNGLPPMDYSCIWVDSNQTLWLGTRTSGLVQLTYTDEAGEWKINQTTIIGKTQGLISNVVTKIFSDAAGHLWIGTDAGVSVLDKRLQTAPVNFSTQNGLRSPFVTAIVEDLSGVIWLGTKSGVAKFVDILTSSTTRKFETYGINDGFPSDDIRSMALGQLGNLWVGTANGLTKLTFSEMSKMEEKTRRLRVTTYGVKNGLVNNQCRFVFADRENNIWVTTYGNGIGKLTSEKFHTFLMNDGLPNEIPGPIATASNGDIWVGTNSGISVFSVEGAGTSRDQYHSRNLGAANGLPNLSIWDFALDKSGSMWVATEKGIARFDGRGFITLREAESFSSNTVRQIEFDNSGNLWIGSIAGLARWNGSDMLKFSRAEGLPSDFIRRLVRDKRGNLWIGTNNGLSRIDHDQVGLPKPVIHELDIPLPERIINDILEDRKHNLWICADGALIQIGLDEQYQIKAVNTIDLGRAGFLNQTLTCMEQDPSGYLWICTTRGVHQYDIESNKVVNVYYRTDGLAGEEGAVADALMVDRDGTLWMSLFGGVTRYLPSLDIDIPTTIPAYVKKFSASSSAKPITEDIILDSKEHNVEIQFIALTFKREGSTKYQYRLTGFDHDWSPPTLSRSVRYTNLDNGNYTFEFRALSPTSTIKTTTVSLDFTILPPFWKQWWFLLLTVGGVIGVGYAAYHTRIRRLEMHSQDLEHRINLRTQEIRKQNDEINRQHQILEKQKTELEKSIVELSKAQTDLIHSKKMASLVQIVAGIAHEMNNPLANIYGNAVHFKEYLLNLRQLLDLYDKEIKGPGTQNEALKTIAEKIDKYKQAVEFDYMMEDISGIVQSIEKSSTRMMQIMKDLRKFSRVDESEIKEVNLNDSLKSILELFMNQYRFSIKIETSFSPIPPALCYAQELNQAFMQMFLNAAQAILDYQELALKEFKNPTIDHSFDLDRGHLRVETKLVESVALKDLDLSLQDIYRGSKNSFIQIRIIDDGIGIKPEIRDKVFDPFFTTRKIGEGIGLGLSVSYSIIEKHQGRIFFNSEYLNGTEFIIELPLKGIR